MHRIPVLPAAFVIAAASCQRAETPADTGAASGGERVPAAAAPTATATPRAPTDLPDTSAPDEPGAVEAAQGITMRYNCDGGHSVAIVRGEIARVTLADGRVVEIPRVAESAPERYSGEALSFDVTSDGGMLGQDETGGFRCREAE